MLQLRILLNRKVQVDIMAKGYLIHYGILGMKWGKRNGPPYPLDASDHSAAEKEAAKNAPGNSPGAKWFDQTIKQGKDKPDISPAENVFKQGGKIVDASSNIVKTVGDAKRSGKPKEDLSKLSDDELRKRINRLDMERRYNDLTSNEVSKGEAYATKALSITGDVLAIGLSAATLIAMLKK